MIAVVNYDRGKSVALGNMLQSIGAEYILTKNEVEIVGADKIILPDSTNLETTVRKLQLLNLSSVLKMLNKPILGINLGLAVLCNKLTNLNMEGLSILPINVNFFSEANDFVKQEHSEIVMKISKSKLLKDIPDLCEFKFSGNHYIPVNKFSTSISVITQISITSTIEMGNINGIMFNPDRSEDLGLTVLKNYLETSV